MVALVALVVVVVAVGLAVWGLRQRSADDVHSVEGYRQTLDTLQDVRRRTPGSVRVLPPQSQSQQEGEASSMVREAGDAGGGARGGGSGAIPPVAPAGTVGGGRVVAHPASPGYRPLPGPAGAEEPVDFPGTREAPLTGRVHSDAIRITVDDDGGVVMGRQVPSPTDGAGVRGDPARRPTIGHRKVELHPAIPAIPTEPDRARPGYPTPGHHDPDPTVGTEGAVAGGAAGLVPGSESASGGGGAGGAGGAPLVFDDLGAPVGGPEARSNAPGRLRHFEHRRHGRPGAMVFGVAAVMVVIAVVAYVAVSSSSSNSPSKSATATTAGHHTTAHRGSTPTTSPTTTPSTSRTTTTAAHHATGKSSSGTDHHRKAKSAPPASTTTTAPPVLHAVSATAATGTYTAPTGAYTINLAVPTGDCWVEVTDQATNQVLFTGTITAGQRRSVSASGTTALNIGAPHELNVLVGSIPVSYPAGYQTPFNMTIQGPQT